MEQIKITLSKLKVAQLKNIARYYNLQERIAFSKLKKKELVDALFEHINYEPALTGEKIEKPKKEKKPKLQRQISTGTAQNLEQLEVQRQLLAEKAQELKKKPMEGKPKGVSPDIEKLRERLKELESQLFF